MSAGALPTISSPRLATLSFVRSVCSRCRSVCLCLCAVCAWLEKPEPLLELGHDLAMTHGKRGAEEKGEATAAAQTLKNNLTPLSSCTGVIAVCRSSALLPRGRGPAVYCGPSRIYWRECGEGCNPYQNWPPPARVVKRKLLEEVNIEITEWIAP